MAKSEPVLEVVTFTVSQDDAASIFAACEEAGFAQDGEGVRDLLLTLIATGVRPGQEDGERPSGAAAAIAEALANPAVRDLLADVGKAGLRRMFRGPK
jgi:hypothetical protein